MSRGAAGRGPALAVVGAAVLAAAAASAWAGPVHAQDAGCDVVVVVDSGQSEPVAACAADPADGLEALDQAGFDVTEVGSFAGAVCRIDQYPETDCGPMPPAEASWSYWVAQDTDDEWTFAGAGPEQRSTDAGDVDGWVFGDGEDPPRLTPAEAADAADEAAPAAEPDAEDDSGGTNLTWIVAVAILAVLGVLIAWRLRTRGRGDRA